MKKMSLYFVNEGQRPEMHMSQKLFLEIIFHTCI